MSTPKSRKPSRGKPQKALGHFAQFSKAEFEQRIERARKVMTREKIDGLLVSSEVHLEYLSGFRSVFPWNSPSRPWYFFLPRVGDAVAVIPEFGATGWVRSSWCKSLATWPSPRPQDEGITLLAGLIKGVKRRYGRFGVELGPESRIGMPVGDLLRLRDAIRPIEMADCVGVLRELRLIKSPAEVARIRFLCQAACDAFDALPGKIGAGDTERDAMRAFQFEVMARGVDKAPFIMPRSGVDGVDALVAGPVADKRLRKGEILYMDQGSKHEGYFCDFNRNFTVGKATDKVRRAMALLYDSTTAGIKAARPGATAEDLFHAQAKVLTDAGIVLGDIGRFGHGLGKNLTEPPSNMPGDRTRLVPGMVMTIEPSLMMGGDRILVREENLVITEDGHRMLTRREPREVAELPA
ncbi:MAG: Xaa-Pro peptidase family protein [Proteobacteria bacterium]|nr:Xaa-Pro peptidase family protein [Pseudomonadota bacterium]